MARARMLVLLALVAVGSGCVGSATAPHLPPKMSAGLPAGPGRYGVFHVRGVYVGEARTSHFGRELHRVRFTLTCGSPWHYEGLAGPPSWSERLCLAILDYATRIPLLGSECNCPASTVHVDVRGTIRSRQMHEHLTTCLCGDGPRAAADARLILRIHPPFRTPAS